MIFYAFIISNVLDCHYFILSGLQELAAGLQTLMDSHIISVISIINEKDVLNSKCISY